jgi:transcriptional regulator with XRE-family HTH domain
MNEQQAIEAIGALIKDGRLEMGLAQKPFADLAGVDAKTLATAEKGRRIPWETNQRKIEAALGWRQGSIQKTLDDAEHIPVSSLTLAHMREGAGEATWQELDAETSEEVRPVTRAGELSNEELIGELAYRLRNKTMRFPG